MEIWAGIGTGVPLLILAVKTMRCHFGSSACTKGGYPCSRSQLAGLPLLKNLIAVCLEGCFRHLLPKQFLEQNLELIKPLSSSRNQPIHIQLQLIAPPIEVFLLLILWKIHARVTP